MLVIMHKDSTAEQSAAVEAAIRQMGFVPAAVPGRNRTAICITGNKGPVPAGDLLYLPGVLECVSITKPYKLVSREVHGEDTVVQAGGDQLAGLALDPVAIGGEVPVIIAGPCSVETEARTLEVARAAREAGATLFRAGAFKPRTNPYEFQGLGMEALHTLRLVREETGMPVVSEILDPESLEPMLEYVDVLQVGTRNMQNTSLLKCLSRVDRPVLLKRGMSASFEEWLMAAEYLLAGGNHRVILCERGIRTFSSHARNTLDLNVVPLARKLSHLPVVVDPSHGVGTRDRVRPMARAALAAGAQGLLIEAHVQPDRSYTDAAQTIDMATLGGIKRDLELLRGLEDLRGSGAAARITA